jgi:hypothetical protein
VDVEQIMRDIRARIGQGSGLELSNAQIQELAARRLEAVLDPQSLNPALLDKLRAATGAGGSALPRPPRIEAKPFDVGALFKKVFGPILKLFFNAEPIAEALNEQARLTAEAASRQVERDRLQAEWNALHYELLRRMVRESARNSLEVQSLALQVESLAAKVEFNERRVRGIEGTAAQPQPRHAPRQTPAEVVVAASAGEAPAPGAPTGVAGEGAAAGEGPRRKRRRRRGRRGTGPFAEATAASGGPAGAADDALQDTDTDTEADAGAEDADVAADEGSEPADTPRETAPEAPVAVPIPEETVHGGAVHAAEPVPDTELQPAPLDSTDEPVDR